MLKKYFLVILSVALLGLAGCAGEERTYVKKPASTKSQWPGGRVAQKADWKLQAEQLERLGDYNGACRVVRDRYLRYPGNEPADRFSLLLSYLSDEELTNWWNRESDKGLMCRVGAEYFIRLNQRPKDDLTLVESELLLDLARLLSSGCEAGENVRAEVEEFLRAHQTAMRKSEIEIGCLLPLSGPNAAAGERFLRGMEIALEVYSRPDPVKNTAASETRSRLPEMALLPRLKVYFYDTAGEGERARAGVDYLVHEKKVDLLLGPYTGKAANYAAAQAQSLGVTMISLSPLLRDLERYPNVFQHYPTIRNQAVSLAELARIRLGIEKFAMLVPRNRYGREFAEDFTAQVQAWGGKVVREVEYDASRPDFGPAIRELIGVRRYRRFKEQRQEYEAWLKQRQYRAAQKQAAAPAGEKPELDGANKLADLAREIGIDGAELNILDEGEIMARPLLNCDFEALVVPDREQTLKLLIPQLAFYDLDECFLLGGRYWNKAEFLDSVSDYAEGSFFVGTSLPVATDDDLEAGVNDSPAGIQARFQAEFAKLNQEKVPGLLEIYGFDTIMLLRQLAANLSSQPDAETWRQLLAGCQNLPLASGLTTTSPDGEIAKALYPLTFKKGHISIVSDICF